MERVVLTDTQVYLWIDITKWCLDNNIYWESGTSLINGLTTMDFRTKEDATFFKLVWG